MKSLPNIGTVELVSLPDDGVKGVPAKIDTGADTSAIWASQISEGNHELSFVLFDKRSQYYNGKVISTRSYQVISVKNSFGKSELRYKVGITITLASRTIKARFTLANRKNNSYPILIGRRTIQGKFLVDVAKKSVKPELHVLLLTTNHTTTTDNFAKNLEKQGRSLRITYATYRDLLFVIGEGKYEIKIRRSGRDISSFDLVYFRITTGLQDVAAPVAAYLEQHSVPFLDKAVLSFSKSNKLYQYILLAGIDTPIPLSVFMLSPQLEKSYTELKRQLGTPFILKDIYGRKGNNNFLVNSQKSFKTACQKAAKNGVILIAQTYVANNGDYRVLIFGNKIALVIKRIGSSATHLNNTSKGSEARLVPISTLPPHVQKTCLAAAKLLQRQVAGVDIIQDKTNNLWYCLEVNSGPQLATGSFTDQKQAAFAEYLERKLG